MVNWTNSVFCLLIFTLPYVLCITTDVCGSDSDHEFLSAVNNSYWKAVGWLKSQQTSQWGWEHTPSIVLSLQLTNPDWFNRDDLESQLNVKQLEIETLAALTRRKISDTKHVVGTEDVTTSDELSAGELAYHILALHATCHDVTDFYGNNLVRLLERRMKDFKSENFNNYFQYSLGVLALCNTKATVKERYIEELEKGLGEDGGYLHGSDSTAMVVTALSCVSKMPEFSDNTKMKFTLQKAKMNLLSCQERDDSFGNIQTSALAAQALTASDVPTTVWKCESVTRNLIEQQEISGSFGDHVMTTMQVLPSLVGSHYSNIDTTHCLNTEKDQGNETGHVDLSGVNIYAETISVKISVITDVNGSGETMLNVDVPVETSLYDIMMALSDKSDVDFSFEAPDSLWGHYVQTINGISGDTETQYYWGIFANYHEPLSVGVDHYYPKDDDHIYFKYVSYSHHDW
ncbi:cobalamin binding intrinsic factor-like [Glandiceps talaboti]